MALMGRSPNSGNNNCSKVQVALSNVAVARHCFESPLSSNDTKRVGPNILFGLLNNARISVVGYESCVRKGWTEEDEQQLKEEFGRSESLRLIAEKHRRTIRAIEARLERLGLFLTTEERTTSDRFFGSSVKAGEGK